METDPDCILSMDIYSSDEIAKQKIIRRRARLAMALVSAAAVIFCAVLMCCVDPLRAPLFRFMASAAIAAAGCFDIYILTYVFPYTRPRPKKRNAGGWILKILSNIFHQLHMYCIWIILSAMLVFFLFNCVTDTSASKKVTVFIDVEKLSEAELEVQLNKDLPAGIKMTKVHSFTYSVFGMNEVGNDDIYIVKESDIERFIEGFAPLDGFLDVRDDRPVYSSGGTVYGILYRPDEAQMGPIFDRDYKLIEWDPSASYYLFFGKNGLHQGRDGAAAYIAKKMLDIE